MDPRLIAAQAAEDAKKGNNLDMVKLQHVLKNNSTDIQSYVDDLDSW
jgi:hypothetical protein